MCFRRQRPRRPPACSTTAGGACGSTTRPAEGGDEMKTKPAKAMDAKRRKRLEQGGYAVGSAAEFLGLSAEEAALVEMRLVLSRALRERREAARLTQLALARLTGSSQSRVAKMEAGDPSVSLDLLIRALLAAGASRREVGQALARRVA